MKRSNVTRSDGGVYNCTFQEIDPFEFPPISGSTHVLVNCKDFLVCDHDIKYILPIGALFNLYILFPSVCADLDPAVISPHNNIFVMEGDDLTVSCNALSSLRTATTWFKVKDMDIHNTTVTSNINISSVASLATFQIPLATIFLATSATFGEFWRWVGNLKSPLSLILCNVGLGKALKPWSYFITHLTLNTEGLP